MKREIKTSATIEKKELILRGKDILPVFKGITSSFVKENFTNMIYHRSTRLFSAGGGGWGGG